MSDVAIRVEGLGKRYRIGASQAPYRTLRETLANLASAPARGLKRFLARDGAAPVDNTIWALKDVSFEVKQGEVIGIIGRNGAGKSTLLKILSRITKPTEGHVDLHGRVGSLLEVGTGFHPELTGRENIYLNGAILGMRRVEIERRFDEIVAFAEIDKFLDTPVKHYSSGMYVRLAFAVAAHLEPEILLVDEVLAVGDASFQKKCLGRMGEVAREGNTVIFVSHNLVAIGSLCSSGVYLESGHIRTKGKVNQAIEEYLSDVRDLAGSAALRSRVNRTGNGLVRIVDFYVTDDAGLRQQMLRAGGDYVFVMGYEQPDREGRRIENTVGSIAITDEWGRVVILLRSSFTNENFRISDNRGLIRCRIADFNLAPGLYRTTLFLGRGETDILDLVEDASGLEVQAGDYFGSGSVGIPGICKVLTRATWSAQ